MSALHFGSVIRVASVQRDDRRTNREQEFAKTKDAKFATWDLAAVLQDPLGNMIEPDETVLKEMEAVRDVFKAKDPDYQGTGTTVQGGDVKYVGVQSFRYHKQMYLVTGEDAQPLSEVHRALTLRQRNLFKNRKTNGLVYDKSLQRFNYHLDPEYKALQDKQRDITGTLVSKATKSLSMRVSDAQRHLPNLPNYRFHQVDITG